MEGGGRVLQKGALSSRGLLVSGTPHAPPLISRVPLGKPWNLPEPPFHPQGYRHKKRLL